MAPFIKGRWGHGGFREREGEQGGERESERETEKERESAASHWLLIVLFLYSVCHNTG